jgi:hypothetical protein
MEYYFDELDPVRFQRLINALLVQQYGVTLQTGPLRGADGGADATAVVTKNRGAGLPVGRHIFQVKHHRMTDANGTKLRKRVMSEYESDLLNLLIDTPNAGGKVFYHLLTNVSSSAETRSVSTRSGRIEGRIWWQSDVVALLDRAPMVWAAFPEIFAGSAVPLIGSAMTPAADGPAATLRASIARRYHQERYVKFRQVELEKELARLFVDLDITADGGRSRESAMGRLHRTAGSWLLIEGGPGQGKSTVTQMAAQIHRDAILQLREFDRGHWSLPEKIRVPLRIELRRFADALDRNTSLEQFLVQTIVLDGGGGSFTVDDLRRLFRDSPVLLILDGLDEIGSDSLRDRVVDEIAASLQRCDPGTTSDLMVVITSRPPALEGRRHRFVGFLRYELLPMSRDQVDKYVERWSETQFPGADEGAEIVRTFAQRRYDPHVAALVQNPMQLAVLLHLIHLKGPAFPTQRAELYREYFMKVIDRDVEKSPHMKAHRNLIEGLHGFMAFEIHALAETGESDGTLTRTRVLGMVDEWLKQEAGNAIDARTLFLAGRERLGLIVSPRGEGKDSIYGFEIQPIREYFAAAYLSERVVGDAHEIWTELLRRPFWREVAIFLAGLRRQNERADLITRAKELDSDAGHGWRQHGRLMIRQLIIDGVFTQPKYLYDAALDYVLDVLDVEKVPISPEMSLATLIPVVEALPSPLLSRRITQLLDRRRDSTDKSEMSALLDFAAVALPSEALKESLMALRPRPEILPYLRLHHGVHRSVSFVADSRKDDFWSGAPATAWIGPLWESMSRCDQARVLRWPCAWHELMFEQYVWATIRPPVAVDRSAMLVWRFAEVEIIATSSVFRGGRELGRRIRRSSAVGLAPSIAEPLTSLIGSAGRLLERQADRRSIRASAYEWLEALRAACAVPGLVSMVAARHGVAMTALHRSAGEFLAGIQAEIRRTVAPFYVSSIEPVVEAIREAGPVSAGPNRVRVDAGPPQDPAKLLVEAARAECAPVFDLIRRFPYGSHFVALTKVSPETLDQVFYTLDPTALEDDEVVALARVASERCLQVLRRARSQKVREAVLSLVHGMVNVTNSFSAIVDALREEQTGRFVLPEERMFVDEICRSPQSFAPSYRRQAATAFVRNDPVATEPLIRSRERFGLVSGPRRSV